MGNDGINDRIVHDSRLIFLFNGLLVDLMMTLRTVDGFFFFGKEIYVNVKVASVAAVDVAVINVAVAVGVAGSAVVVIKGFGSSLSCLPSSIEHLFQ